jgi:hypothetical protein
MIIPSQQRQYFAVFTQDKTTQVRLARGKQKSDSDDLDPTLDPVPQQCVRKTFSASFVPQPAENNTYLTSLAG